MSTSKVWLAIQSKKHQYLDIKGGGGGHYVKRAWREHYRISQLRRASVGKVTGRAWESNLSLHVYKIRG